MMINSFRITSNRGFRNGRYDVQMSSLCGAISALFSVIKVSDAGAIWLEALFNMQNFIPHKSQKAKAVPETSRVKEFQRETAGVLESAKEGVTGHAEGLGIGLGEYGQPDKITK